MARKAIDILKAQGYTDAELTDMQPMLTAKFCAALEAEDAGREKIALEAAKYKSDLDATTVWYQNEAVPALNKALSDATTARGEAARVNAQLKYMQETGLARIADQVDGTDNTKTKTNAPVGDASFDASKYVSAETFLQTTDRFGEAIAVATDIAEDHRELFGARIPGGVTQLRKEYQDAVKNHRFNGDLRSYWADKYQVAAKQTERSQAAHQKELDEYANAKIKERMSDAANPMTRALVPSRNPFTAKAAATGTTTGQMPWERGATVEQRRGERVVRFAQKVIEKTA